MNYLFGIKTEKNWRKICENNRVIFSGIQKNAILYLACKSKGVESTMCWNEDNKPYWVVIRDYDINN